MMWAELSDRQSEPAIDRAQYANAPERCAPGRSIGDSWLDWAVIG